MSDETRSAARDPRKPFCEGGTLTCEVCVGSCGIEEYEARSAALTRWRGLYGGTPAEQKLVNSEALATLLSEFEALEAALIECVRISGADTSSGIPSWPPLPAWAINEVTQLREDYDAALKEVADNAGV